MMRPEEIAREICEDYGFKVVVIVAVDKKDALQVAGADENSTYDILTSSLLARVIDAVKGFVGRMGNPTVH